MQPGDLPVQAEARRGGGEGDVRKGAAQVSATQGTQEELQATREEARQT